MLKGIAELYLERWSFFSGLLVEHMVLTGISVAIVTVAGLAIGIAMTFSERLAKIVLAVVNFLYTIPSIALFGFLVILSGIGAQSAITALVIYGLLPMIRNTYVGIREVDKQIIESAVGMGCTSRQLLLRVELPLALPVIFAGFRTMVVMVIALGGIASFIGAGGLGVAIWRGITTNFPEMTIAGSLLVALLAIVTDGGMELIERQLRKKLLGTVN